MNTKLGNHYYNDSESRCITALNFYDIVLKNQIHYITTYSFDYFQSLINSLLQTQLVYHNPAYIAERGTQIAGIYDLYKELSTAADSFEIDASIENYITHNFFNDIVFIEQTNTLKSHAWYKEALVVIQNHTRQNSIPIIIATLEKEPRQTHNQYYVNF